YSASMTGVIGITLSRRTVPPDPRATLQAVAIARLARSVSARSTGTRILLNMAHPPAGEHTIARASRRSRLYPGCRGVHLLDGVSGTLRVMRSPARSPIAGLGRAAKGSGPATPIPPTPSPPLTTP